MKDIREPIRALRRKYRRALSEVERVHLATPSQASLFEITKLRGILEGLELAYGEAELLAQREMFAS